MSVTGCCAQAPLEEGGHEVGWAQGADGRLVHPKQGHSLLNEGQSCSLSAQPRTELLCPHPGQGLCCAPPRC